MKPVLTILAVILSTSSLFAASSAPQTSKTKMVMCVFNESQDGQNFKASGQPARLEVVDGAVLTLNGPTESIKGYIQMGSDNRYTISIVNFTNGEAHVLAFSMASTLDTAMVLSNPYKVGIGCSQAMSL